MDFDFLKGARLFTVILVVSTWLGDDKFYEEGIWSLPLCIQLDI